MKPEFTQLLEAGTAAIADVFDALDQVPLVVDNRVVSIGESDCCFAGPAYTIAGESFRWSGSGDRLKLEAIDLMPECVVAVWAGADIRGVCCFGDLLATAMKARGASGVVVDGGVRDTAFINRLDLPVMARYRTPGPGHRQMACLFISGSGSNSRGPGGLDYGQPRGHHRGRWGWCCSCAPGHSGACDRAGVGHESQGFKSPPGNRRWFSASQGAAKIWTSVARG